VEWPSALKIISLVFEAAGRPDGGTDHDHDALILMDLTVGDRPAEMWEMTCASQPQGRVAAS